MALSRQIHIYSVDTKAFYTDVEVRADDLLNKVKAKARVIKEKDKESRSEEERIEYTKLNKKIKKIKDMLNSFMSKNDDIRELRDEYLNDRNIISVFESTLTRTCGYKTNELTKDMIVVKTYHYNVLEDLIKDGFYIDDEKYKVFTASAGQIRTKKTVFIKESVWNKYEKSLTCDLTIKDINDKGGINVNKYLAYLALTNSATDQWVNFDIDKSIVVDDFETTFKTKVDYIDSKTFEIKPKIDMDIEIPHMDGCGIILPKVNRRSFMVRMPWVKGLLVPFQFNSFVKENLDNNPECSKIKDVYGKEYDIFKDDIQVIFTKSQFKMWKYYESWDDYKTKFKKNNCQAGICNEERDFIKDAKINYQMLQTLTDMTDEELSYLAERINKDIEGLYTDRNSMLKVFGAVESNNNRNNVQEILMIYPEILQEEHFRQTLRDLKNKLVKQGRSGKLPLDAKYTFIVPDLYAFCEWLFLGEDNPEGLLNNGEVYCRLYQNKKELDVLRSPHLFLEHAVRKNVCDDKIKRWFITKGAYTSVHDPISRILQFDNDGDTALVCADEKLVEIAKRNVEKHEVVPLYYEMAKAGSVELSNNQFYDGMISAYSGGNIGAISNDITKIWNSDEPNLDAVKYLCMMSNFTIDFAKTLYKPKVPDDINNMIKAFTKNKTPHFFVYAKDKTISQVEPINNSVVNRLEWIVEDRSFNWNKVALQKFNYRMLLCDKQSDINQDIVNDYEKLKNIAIHNNVDWSESKNMPYSWVRLREELESKYDKIEIVDTLTLYLFRDGKQRTKKIFIGAFADVILENVRMNITRPLGEYILCERCGKRIKSINNKIKYCDRCADKIYEEQSREKALRYYHKTKTLPNRNTP